MVLETIEYKGRIYPKLQSEGNAAQYIKPFALKICQGNGYDIGCSKEEWKLDGARGIDINKYDGYHANNLPDDDVDYIFSSHCLEHVENPYTTLEYWISKLKNGGVLFLYLPDYSQEYWRPWNNRKHIHVMNPDILKNCLEHFGMKNIFCSGADLNGSFAIVCEK